MSMLLAEGAAASARALLPPAYPRSTVSSRLPSRRLKRGVPCQGWRPSTDSVPAVGSRIEPMTTQAEKQWIETRILGRVANLNLGTKVSPCCTSRAFRSSALIPVMPVIGRSSRERSFDETLREARTYR